MSARTARDPSRPDGYRVRALWNCMEYFHPFGFHATRNQLMRLTGVLDGYWSMEQVLQAVDVLEQTRAPWAAHAREQLQRARAAARGRPRPTGPGDGELWVDWFSAWLTAPGHAELWGVAEFGECEACGHLRALHGRGTCSACWSDPATPDGEPCRLPSPLCHEYVARPPRRPAGRRERLARLVLRRWGGPG